MGPLTNVWFWGILRFRALSGAVSGARPKSNSLHGLFKETRKSTNLRRGGVGRFETSVAAAVLWQTDQRPENEQLATRTRVSDHLWTACPEESLLIA